MTYKKLLIILCATTTLSICFASGRTWYKKANVGGEARHRCTAFSIGNKGYYGGGHVNSGTVVTYKDYWEYDPATNSWTQIADFGGGLRYHSSAFTIGDVAYVGGGEDHESNYTNDFWKYIPEINTWYPIANLPSTPRRGGVAFVIDDKGYYGTGQSHLGYHSDFYCYDPVLDEWDTIASMPGDPRNAAVSFTHNGKGYVGTGHKIGAALNDFYQYDPISNTWETKSPVGGSIRQDAMGFVIDGKGYIGTGNDNLGTDFGDIWEYDFELDTWTEIEEFLGEKRRYAATFTINDIPYIIGGTDGTNFKDTWAFAPAVSINEHSKTSYFNAFPNPSNNQIKLSFAGNLNSTDYIAIYTIQGQLILKISASKNNILERDYLGSGCYIVKYFSDNQLMQTEKIIFN